ncbi:MAG TPA: DUF4910 domain-containing protein [Planctomycetota bacterium]|nr:DUF4910 domain-containing protein [Planctomycetota bacterium]HRR82985.1 DUF4910 domain-containing protein [Planctomycetota bacterium]HRT93898.1 DUF4910 domain-containing protein [Planctomycetota bacterium]
MYESIWQAVKAELSGESARDYTARLWEHARWNSFEQMRQTAGEIAAIMRETGLADVQVIEYPADGTTSFGGWVMPEAWDAEDAWLELVEPAEPPLSSPPAGFEPAGGWRLADYRSCPMSLFMYSAATPPEGVVAEVIAVENAAKAESYDGVDVAGKIVLADGVGIETGLNAFERGAAGVISDAVRLAGSPQEKAPGHFDHAAQWHNYTIPPWKSPKAGFGFALAPSDGRRLRELLKARPVVRLRAVVKTRRHRGVLPLVTGLLPGETGEEIALTGHLCEPGANDNSSGCALGLEVVRAIKALAEAGKLPRLQRGLRIVYSFEVRGYQAFLANWPHLRRLVAGINLDMVGNDLSDARARATLLTNWAALPAATDALAVELMRRLGRDDPLLRFRTDEGALVDNLFGEPAVGAPMAVLGCWPDAYYHTSLDTLDHISPKALAHFGRVAATYCAFLATAGFREAAWLARLTLAFAKEQVVQAAQRGESPERIEHLAAKNGERLRWLARLVPARSLAATRENLEKHREWLCPWSHLFEREEIVQHAERLGRCLAAFARREVRAARGDERYARRLGMCAKPAVPAKPPAREQERAKSLVPVRTFRGSVCFESLDEAGRKELKAKTGLAVGWGAPHWLDLALFRCNGKRTALEVWRWLQLEGQGIDLAHLNDTVEFLAARGFVRLRPVLRRDEVRAALDVLGVPRGAVLMVHSSLSQFGYIEGGADAVIDALLDAVGPEGTLAMPTLSCSWVGRPPYDPATTPSRVGAVTEAFRKRQGVLRSPHPTHSVAAFGPRAAEIVSGHTPDRPVFAPEGAFGKLYELDAWILMLCKLAANTTMHMGDERNGLLLLDFLAYVMEGGKPREVVVRHVPWHVNFEPSYEAMRQRGQLRSAPLGEGTIHLMRARDAVDAATESVRRNPLLVTGGEKCQCDFCLAIRAKLVSEGK